VSLTTVRGSIETAVPVIRVVEESVQGTERVASEGTSTTSVASIVSVSRKKAGSKGKAGRRKTPLKRRAEEEWPGMDEAFQAEVESRKLQDESVMAQMQEVITIVKKRDDLCFKCIPVAGDGSCLPSSLRWPRQGHINRDCR